MGRTHHSNGHTPCLGFLHGFMSKLQCSETEAKVLQGWGSCDTQPEQQPSNSWQLAQDLARQSGGAYRNL